MVISCKIFYNFVKAQICHSVIPETMSPLFFQPQLLFLFFLIHLTGYFLQCVRVTEAIYQRAVQVKPDTRGCSL